MLETGEEEAEKQGVPMSMAIRNAGGNLIPLAADNAALFSMTIAMDKAFTAVFGKMPTGSFADFYRMGELVPLLFHKRWITFPGGFPIIKDGMLLGGIGVSGRTIEDVYVARTAWRAGDFLLDAVDAVITNMTADAQKKREK
jgi:uncharacterized protein GlcG (DUF336 family)